MKLYVTRLGYRTNAKENIAGIDIPYDIRSHAPSDSRMAMHQWPTDEKIYQEVFPRIVAEAERIRGAGQVPSLDNMNVRGVRFLRLTCDEKFFAEIVA